MSAASTRPFSLPFGGSSVETALAADLIAPPAAAPLADARAAILDALERPIGTGPLTSLVRPGERVALIVNDVTRLARTDLLLPPVVETLNRAGVPDRDILVVFALGTHRRQTDQERRSILGDDLFGRLRAIDHDCGDAANLVELGRTRFGNTVKINRQVWESDRIILTGEIIHHQIAGYSGGPKSLVPGVAGRGTITFNHRMIFEARCASGVLDGNPAHEDLLEGCHMADPDFIVNLVLSPAGQALHVVAGHYEAAHREGCRVADALLQTRVSGLYDLVVASAGGHPLDIDLRQAHKGLENVARAVKPGGSILYFAECPNGAGSPALEQFLERYAGEAETEAALRSEFVVGGHKAWWLRSLGRRFDLHFVSRLEPRWTERCGFRAVDPADYEASLRELVRRAGPQARLAVMPGAGFTRPVVEAAPL